KNPRPEQPILEGQVRRQQGTRPTKRPPPPSGRLVRTDRMGVLLGDSRFARKSNAQVAGRPGNEASTYDHVDTHEGPSGPSMGPGEADNLEADSRRRSGDAMGENAPLCAP